jgi:proline iminopeptidase
MDKSHYREPHDSGYIEVEDNHQVYWECHGNPNGRPAVYFHGGPGGGFSRRIPHRSNRQAYRVLLFDQRGCGRSRPLANGAAADLRANTTHHLIADVELLREHLGIDQWTLLGLSWGTTLGLAYAQVHPKRVTSAVFGLVTTTSRRNVAWITEGVGRIFPREWARFAAVVPDHLRDRPLVDAYAELLFDRDPQVQAHAAKEWCTWEDAHVSLAPSHKPKTRYQDPAFRLLFARLVTHYWRNAAFLEPDQLLRDTAILNGIPGVLIHGRFDVSGPLETAWLLSQHWTTSRLRIIDDAGHGGGGFGAAVTAALAEFAT